ncbi:MAG: AGE family epimerase/isomerase [Bacteroidota bacterium]|nr:AGE family epimerase/isomerase [Bacteroidota bacterium]
MTYTEKELKELELFYLDQLLNDTLPFWFPKSIDKECGGYLLMRTRAGDLLDDDKAVWIQGRATWLLGTLYNTVEKNGEWLEGAKSGYDFLNKYCFDDDGRMFFHVTRSGNPIRKRRYFFSETFFVIGASAYAIASGDDRVKDKAIQVFKKCIEYAETPSLLPSKYSSTRPSRGLGVPMIMINTAQELRKLVGGTWCNDLISAWISEIETLFVKDELRCVMEQVAPDGSIIDHVDGRTVTPGHAIEGAWFILNEAKYRNNDQHLIDLGCKMLDYMWERGWDKEYGGMLYYTDVFNNPVQEYWQDMKFWWPHNESIIATLLAYLLTGNEKYAHWHNLVHEYSYSHFHDKKYGEWYGYLHRDGTLAQSAKGNLFKGPFHLPRQELYCYFFLKNYLK